MDHSVWLRVYKNLNAYNFSKIYHLSITFWLTDPFSVTAIQFGLFSINILYLELFTKTSVLFIEGQVKVQTILLDVTKQIF